MPRGLSYSKLDLFAHLNRIIDDPHVVVSLNPPSSRAGYEIFFDTGGAVGWAEPDYEVFNIEFSYIRAY